MVRNKSRIFRETRHRRYPMSRSRFRTKLVHQISPFPRTAKETRYSKGLETLDARADSFRIPFPRLTGDPFRDDLYSSRRHPTFEAQKCLSRINR